MVGPGPAAVGPGPAGRQAGRQVGKNTKIVIKKRRKTKQVFKNGSPRGRFERLGVETGSKLHARHDEHSEIAS